MPQRNTDAVVCLPAAWAQALFPLVSRTDQRRVQRQVKREPPLLPPAITSQLAGKARLLVGNSRSGRKLIDPADLTAKLS